MARNWSASEVEYIVSDYLDMLVLEIEGKSFNKAARNRDLRERLNGRSKTSVEFKHSNISAAMLDMGMPFIDGYKPRGNYQKMLEEAIGKLVQIRPDVVRALKRSVDPVVATPSVDNILAALVDPPRERVSGKDEVREKGRYTAPTGVDYLALDAANQALGDAGEVFAENYERARLIHADRASLADRVERVSVTGGPSAGFDIRSFEQDGRDRFIEAKTTSYGPRTPFYVTPNELRFSRENRRRYHVYRLFDFRRRPRLFSLKGYVAETCDLAPSEFRATVR